MAQKRDDAKNRLALLGAVGVFKLLADRVRRSIFDKFLGLGVLNVEGDLGVAILDGAAHHGALSGGDLVGARGIVESQIGGHFLGLPEVGQGLFIVASEKDVHVIGVVLGRAVVVVGDGIVVVDEVAQTVVLRLVSAHGGHESVLECLVGNLLLVSSRAFH